MLRKILVFIFIVCSVMAKAQILDDSTKQVYSDKTVEFIKENDLFNNTTIKNHPDTLLKDFQLIGPMFKNNWLYQDLGNYATATKPLIFEPVNEIFQTSGFNRFDLYKAKPVDFKYFNTKSPYTNLNYIQGFNGFTQLDFTHSRNVNKQLNFTLNVSKFNSDKQYAYSNSNNRILINHWSYEVLSNYVSKNKKYTGLAAFYHFNQAQSEQGGVKLGTNAFIQPDSIKNNYNRFYTQQLTTGVYSRERSNNLHIYQQYKLGNGFQLFYMSDFKREFNYFIDPSFASNKSTPNYNLAKYDSLKLTAINQKILFKTFSNQAGIKGRFGGFDYRAYIRLRSFSNVSYFDSKINKGTETFVGGQLAYYLKDSLNKIVVDGELRTSTSFANIKNGVSNLLNAKLNFYNFEANLNVSSKPVGMFFQSFNNGVLFWNPNTLKAINQQQLQASYFLKLGQLILRPEIKYTRIKNYTYLTDKLTVNQVDSSSINIFNIGNSASYRFRKLFVSNYSIFNFNNSTNYIHLPFFVSNFHFESSFKYAKALNINYGLDIYYKSTYLADNYSSILQHYYYQNTYKAWDNGKNRGVWVIDPFLAFKLNKVKIALKYANVGQILSNLNILSINKGFYTTPYYLSNPALLFLKVEWPLFD